MYVVCFYWQGDRWQHKNYVEKDPAYVNQQEHFIEKAGKVDIQLAARYVNNLFKGVQKYADREFKFVCFTNESLPHLHHKIEVRSFEMVSRMGVLPRLYMFSKEAGLFGYQVLCLDLDVIIVGSLEGLMSYDGPFCTRSKFKRGEEHKLDGDIMSFKAEPATEEIFWKPFIRDVEAAEELTKGRERYWIRHVAGDFAERWDHVAPGSVISWKRHVSHTNRRPIPEGTAIVSCHGTPRPHQIKNHWINQYWKQQ